MSAGQRDLIAVGAHGAALCEVPYLGLTKRMVSHIEGGK